MTTPAMTTASPPIHPPHRPRFIMALWGVVALAASGCATNPVARPATLADIAAGRAGVGPELAGLAVVVADRRHELRAEAYGRAIIDPAAPARERPMTVDSLVRVASVSKLVTTLGIMRLVEAGRLNLDRDVSAYLGWTLRNPAFPDMPVTLRLLLSHRSTIVDDGGYFWPLGTRLRDSLAPASWHAADPPGRYFSYANLNYGIAAEVMEAATGERFDRLMTRLVFAPLKLDACYNWSGCSDTAVARAAALYRKGADEAHWNPAGPWIAQIDDLGGAPPACLVRTTPASSYDLALCRPGDNGTLFSPQGGVRISPRDLAKIGRMLLSGGTLDGRRLLASATVRAMMTPQWRLGDTPVGETYNGLMRCWGLSMQCLVGDRAGEDQPLFPKHTRWWGHLGDAYGAWTGLWLDPKRGRVYVLVVTGTADDPANTPRRNSQFHAFEEAILVDLAR